MSLRTAQRHRQQAQDLINLRGEGGNLFLPDPQRVELQTPSSSPHNSDNNEPSSCATPPASNSPNRSPHSPRVSPLIETEQHSPEIGRGPVGSADKDGINMALRYSPREDTPDDGVGSLPIQESNDLSDAIANYDKSNSKFRAFALTKPWLIGFSLRHNATGAMMDDLLVQTGAEYSSWNGVRAALLRSSGLDLSQHPYCARTHKALHIEEDNTVSPCDHQYCLQAPITHKAYTYIGLWDRLEALVQNKTTGPEMFEYFRENLNVLHETDNTSEYVDFFSGSLFKDAVAKLGGSEAVQDDIFLTLSTDGVQAFGSSEYSYWPVLLTVLNLRPSQRFKPGNVLPVTVIPGPSGPVDLVSFLNPLLDELEELRKGRIVTLWDGSRRLVRVHLLFATGDLPAIAKLCSLRGHNGRSPCRFCYIHGFRVVAKRHIYYPSAIRTADRRGGKRRRVVKTLWHPWNLPLRSEEETLSALEAIEQTENSGDHRQAEEMCKDLGVKSFELSLLIHRMPHIHAFESFPIDIMHLLYLNVAKDMLSLWTSVDPTLRDIACLFEKERFQLVDNFMARAGTGIGFMVRRPRGISQRGQWKAIEWKFFVQSLSMAALHDVIPKETLDGWWLFVQLCETVSLWHLSNDDVSNIRTLARQFFEHFQAHYYQLDEDRIHLNKYVYHLLLHLADSVCACGPLSLVAQWTMENYAGDVNRRCKAKNLFAESVATNMKFQSATRLYALREGLEVPYIDLKTTIEEQPSSSLFCVSSLGKYKGYSFRHPRRAVSVSEAEEILGSDIKARLCDYYRLEEDFSEDEAKSIVQEWDKLVIWSRLFDEKSATQEPTMYKSRGASASIQVDSRSSCHFAGVFAADNNILDLYYGNSLAFIEHNVDGNVHMLVLAAWVVRGLRVGEQKQIYANYLPDSSRLFSQVRLESVHCVSHSIAALEAQKIKHSSRKVTRTYFIDQLRGTYRGIGHLSIASSPNQKERFRLKGIS